MEQNLQLTDDSGMICDNPNCDWEDKTVKPEDVASWLNKPCPKCGENLLTQEDFDNFIIVMAMVKMINSLSPDELKLLSGTKDDKKDDVDNTAYIMKVGTHREISIDIVEKAK